MSTLPRRSGGDRSKQVTIYRMMNRDDFPKATKLGIRAIGWRQSVVHSWIEGRCDG
ncbi:helix-turn-helix transcriptional regulator [Sulfitobacter pontiacus]